MASEARRGFAQVATMQRRARPQRQTAFVSKEEEHERNDVRSQDAEQCEESDARHLDMAALLDHADSDGLLRDSGAGDSQTMHVGQHVGEQLVVTAFGRAGGDARRVQLWNHRETASRRHPMA